MAKYFTVVLTNIVTNASKTFRGVAAKSRDQAVGQSLGKVNDNSAWRCEAAYESKRRKLQLTVGNRWSKGRSRHEVREQNRSIWAVLAKSVDKRGLRVTERDPVLYYHAVIERAYFSFEESPFQSTASSIERLFTQYKEAIPNAALPDYA